MRRVALRQVADRPVDRGILAVVMVELAVSFEELNTLVGFDDVQAIERRFLTKDQLARKYRDAAQ